jgi:hypothetical protein
MGAERERFLEKNEEVQKVISITNKSLEQLQNDSILIQISYFLFISIEKIFCAVNY